MTMRYLIVILLQIPDTFDPRTWPAGWIIIGVFAFFWILKQFAEAASSVRTLRDNSLSVWGWLKTLFISARQQATTERAELKASVDILAGKCAATDGKISEVLEEVKPNGGKSLRDEVTTMADKVDHTAAWIRHQKETSDTPIFILKGDGSMDFMNCAFRELVASEESDLAHKNYLSRIEASDRRRFIEELNVAIENKIPFDTIVHFKQDGPYFAAVRLQATPNVAHGSILKGFFGTASRCEGPDSIHRSQA